MIAITYATEQWLAELARSGWELRAVEYLTPERRTTIRVVEDDFEELDFLAPARRAVGVVAAKGESGAFVPCSSEVEAHELLERVARELED